MDLFQIIRLLVQPYFCKLIGQRAHIFYTRTTSRKNIINKLVFTKNNKWFTRKETIPSIPIAANKNGNEKLLNV